MNAVLLLGHVLGHWDQGLKAHHTDSVLIVVRELSEDGKQFFELLILSQLGGELSNFLGASSSILSPASICS